VTRPFDVVVVGGGLAGLCVAYHLVAEGTHTALVDRADAGRATDAGAGILSPATTAVPADLALACGAYYASLAPSLGDDVSYGQCGLLAVALADWDVEVFEALLASATARGGVAEIEPSEARERFPALGEVTRALWSPSACRVDGRVFSAAVRRAAVGRGLTVVDASASQVAAGSVWAGGSELSCRAVVIAGGAWSADIGAQVGVDLPVTPERGQIVHLATGVDTSAWPIVSPVMGDYFVPWPDGRVVTGATREAGAGFAPRPTVAGVRQLVNEVARVAPGLVDAAIVEIRVGLRPASADGRAMLGEVAPGVFVATGYGADGLLLSPWCGRLVASWVLGATPGPEMAPFLASRFV